MLDCPVPLILGMTFFKDICPKVDWASREVLVKDHGRVLKL